MTPSISIHTYAKPSALSFIFVACLLSSAANAQSVLIASWNFGAGAGDSNYSSVTAASSNTTYFGLSPLLSAGSTAVSPTGSTTPSIVVSPTDNKLQYSYPASSTFNANNTLITLSLVAQSSITLSNLSVSFDYAHAPSFNQLYANWTDSSNNTVFRQLISFNANTLMTLTQALNSSVTLSAGQTLTLKLALDGLNKANTYIYMDNFSVNAAITPNGSQQLPPAVPEPSTYGLALGGLALVAVALKRRNRSSK